MRRSFTLIIFLWQVVSADPFSVQVHFPTEEVVIGKAFPIELVLEYPNQYAVKVNELTSQLLQHSPIYPIAPFALEAFSEKQVLDGKKIKQGLSFMLLPQLEGSFFLSFQKIFFYSKEDGEEEMRITPVIPITAKVGTILPLPTPIILPIQNHFPMELSYNNRLFLHSQEQVEPFRNQSIESSKTFPWYLFIFVILLLVSLWFGFALRKQLLLPKPPIPLTPGELQRKALKAIESLQSKKVQNSVFYKELIYIVKDYLEKRYRIEAHVYTTEELINQLSHHPELNDHTRHLLAELNQKADLVRFGHYPSSEEDREASKLQAKELCKEG